MDRFEKKVNTFTQKWIDLGYTLGIYWGVGDIVSAMQLLAVVAVGAFLAAGGNLSIGQLLIFISYTQTIAWPVRHWAGRCLR
jgi:ATP-binding cassette subfamily B protein